jgi:hypothetical protein
MLLKGLCMHRFDRAFRFVLPAAAVAILATVSSVGWFTQPDRFAKGYAPEQPIPFSHELHAGTLRMQCQYCHSGVDRSRHAGIPSVDLCMGCHKVTRTDRPAIQKLTRIANTGEPLPWQRVHTLPDHVFFDHRPHVNAGITCQSCHGEVQTMKVLTREMGMRMGNCLGCHRDPHAALPPDSKITKGAENCAACHR